MVHGCRPNAEGPGLEGAPWLDLLQAEGIAELGLDLQSVFEHPGRGEERQWRGLVTLAPPSGEPERIQVEEVIEVAVRDSDGVDLVQTDVTLEVGHCARS